jgi:two-component system OmpR family response regulator
VRALTRRGAGGSTTLVEYGGLTYDRIGRVAKVGGRSLALSARELVLLELLLRRADRTVSKDQIHDFICEWSEEVSTNAIEVYVHRLRRKLEAADVEIVTARGLGYRLQKAGPH